MATYSVSVTASSSTPTTTQNVAVGDTVNVTISAGSTGATVFTTTTTNCSVSPTSDNSSPYQFSITGFTSGQNYNLYMFYTADGTNFVGANVGGSVSSGSSITPPTVNNTQTFGSTNAANISHTVALSSSGSGGTLQYNVSTSTTTPTSGWQSSASVTVTRGTAYYFWARRSTSAVDRSDSAITVPYLLADGEVTITPGSQTISSGASSASVTVSDVARSSENSVVRVNNGSTNLSNVGTGNNATLTWSSSLPSAGGSPVTYEIFTRRPTSTGGDGTTWRATNDTFTVSRASSDTAPVVNNTQTFASTEDDTISHTVSLSSSGSGGTLEYNKSTTTSTPTSGWVTGAVTVTRGTSYYFWARRSSSLVDRSDSSITVPYLSPDTNIDNISNQTIDNTATAFYVVIANGTSGTVYEVRSSSYTGSIEGSRDGNGHLDVYDTPSGSSKTYYLTAYKTTASGGSGTSGRTNIQSFTVTRAPLDTSITLLDSSNNTLSTYPFTLTSSASSYQLKMSGGGDNTIYYILNVSNFADGSNIDALRQNGDSRYIARTFTANDSSDNYRRWFETTSTTANTITNDLPSEGTYDTFYLYAANSLGQNSTKLSNTYNVSRADTNITLTPSATTLTTSDTNDVTVNVTGDTANTQYRLYSDDLGTGRWVSTYNGGGSATNDFLISYDEDPTGSDSSGVPGSGTGVTELPTSGNTITYYSQARVVTSNTARGPWIDTGDEFDISRNAGGPDAFSFTDITGASTGQDYEDSITLSGLTTSVPISITSVGTAQYKIGSGSYTTSSGTVTNGQTVTVKVTASSSASTTTSGTLNVNGVTDTFSVTTQGSTTGSSGNLGGVSSGWGLKCIGPNGSSVVFSPDHRTANIVDSGTVTLQKGGPSASGSTFSVEGVGSVAADKLLVSMSYDYFAGNLWVTITRSTANGGTITFTNTSPTTGGGAVYTITYLITRVG